jgi:predicted N-acetyltransferase YhbS
MSPHVTTRRAEDHDVAAISALHEKAFGPGRFARTAYRVREGTPDVSPYCRVALLGQRTVAALRLTEITIGGKAGALLLGPLAVDPDFVGQGHGRRLVSEALEAARAGAIALVVLVGDEPYYGRFGFRPVPPGRITLPGPVDPRRILAAELAPAALSAYRGLISPAVAAWVDGVAREPE